MSIENKIIAEAEEVAKTLSKESWEVPWDGESELRDGIWRFEAEVADERVGKKVRRVWRRRGDRQINGNYIGFFWAHCNTCLAQWEMECGFVPTVDPFKSTIGLSHVKPNLLGAHRRLIIFDVGCVKIIVESWSSPLVVCRDSNASGLNGDPTWLVPSMDVCLSAFWSGSYQLWGSI